MLNQLIKVAYPHLSEDSPNLDSYFLVRLGELWGEGLIEEYLECLQPSEKFSPNLADNNPQKKIVNLSV